MLVLTKNVESSDIHKSRHANRHKNLNKASMQVGKYFCFTWYHSNVVEQTLKCVYLSLHYLYIDRTMVLYQ